MRIAVLGTGPAGRTLAAGIAAIGHEVALGTRSPDETRARPETAQWYADQPRVELSAFADAVTGADLVVNATSGQAAVDAVVQARLAPGQVLLDAANPLDFSAGFPPTLLVKDTDSLAEQVQRAVPHARVVKCFNTVTASVMVDPSSVGDGDHTLFLAGDDAEAKAAARALLGELGWRDVIDLGPLEAARGLEMYLPLWVRLMGALGTAEFNIKVVR